METVNPTDPAFLEWIANAPPLVLVLVFLLAGFFIWVKYSKSTSVENNKEDGSKYRLDHTDKCTECFSLNQASKEISSENAKDIHKISTDVTILNEHVKSISESIYRLKEKQDDKLEKIVLVMTSMYNDLEDVLDLMKDVIRELNHEKNSD